MRDVLRRHDPSSMELQTPDGAVLVTPHIQGRVFCHLGGEVIHRVDASAVMNPSGADFNNAGGNSLWPAPEGGDFAFNYLPASDAWVVQPGVNTAPYTVVSSSQEAVTIEKTVALRNRKGVDVRLAFRRAVRVTFDAAKSAKHKLLGISYTCTDTITPCDQYSAREVLVASWSLEQFPGCLGVTAFAKVSEPHGAINADFYGDPGGRIRPAKGHFEFHLGGEDRQQIGIRAASRPEFIGALDPARCLLVLRKTAPMDGVYFNIADNAQPKGPFSAADMYSIFNGGALHFYELETIGAMQVKDGCVAASPLTSETWILKGKPKDLRSYLAETHGVALLD